jgi:hypothetical protein
MTVYKYTSPYRPLVFSYVPSGINWLYDYSTIWPWKPETIYAFDKPLPEFFIEQWSLIKI